MIPTLLITLREVIEASLIVATVLGILVKRNQNKSIKSVWVAAVSALAVSFVLVVGGSLVGVNIQKIYTPTAEGALLIISALFVTWAVFSLHKQFAHNKMTMLSRMSEALARDGIFLFTFVAVLREGIEIVLFLSTMYLTSAPLSIISGFSVGVVLGLFVSFLFFTATVRLPIFWAFRMTSYLLILSAANLLARGLEEFPIRAINTLPLIASLTYIFLMHRWVFVRSR